MFKVGVPNSKPPNCFIVFNTRNLILQPKKRGDFLFKLEFIFPAHKPGFSDAENAHPGFLPEIRVERETHFVFPPI